MISQQFRQSLKTALLTTLFILPLHSFANKNYIKTQQAIFQWTSQSTKLESNISDAVKSMVAALKGKQDISFSKLNQYYKKTIKDAMAPYGYFSPHITIQDKTINGQAVFKATIIKNKPVKIKHISIRIDSDDAVWAALKKDYPMQVGEILQTTPFSQYKNKLFETASQYGYFNATLKKSTITVDRKQHWADISIHFAPEQRFRFGKLTIHSFYLRKQFIHRFVNFKTGQLFNANYIHELQNNLQKTQFFSYLQILPKPNLKKHLVNIAIYTHTGKRIHYELGVGYGSDMGVRGTIGLQILPLNKRGHSFQVITRLASGHQLVDGSYNIPGHNPVNTQYSFFTHIYQNIYPVGTTMSSQFGAEWTQIFHPFKHHIITQSVQAYYLSDHYHYNYWKNTNVYATKSMVIGALSYTISPPLKNLNATQALSWQLGIQGAKKGFSSPITFVQYNSLIDYLKTFKKGWRLVLGNHLAYTQVDHIYDLPLSLQILTGGSNSLRGYDYNSIGPAKLLAVGSIDLQKEIKNGWYVGAFYDCGSLSNALFKPFLQSAGPTLTKSTPVGGLTLSLAKPLADPDHPHWKLTFNWGERF